MTDKTSWFAESAEHHPADLHRQDWADRFRGAMIGGGIGDALGAGIRHWSSAEIRQCFGPGGVEDYLPIFGRRGAVTDLTQLSVFTLEALLRAKAVNPDPTGWLPTQVVGTNHLRWLFTQGVPWEYAMSAHLQTHPEPSGWLLERPELFVTRNPAGMALRGMGTLAGASPAGRGEATGPPLGDASLVDCVVWAAPTMVWSSSPELVFAASTAISKLLTTNGGVHGATGLHSDVLAQLIRGVELWEAVQESEAQRLDRVYDREHPPANVRRAVQAAMFASRGGPPASDELDVAFDTGGKLGELGIALTSVACTETFADALHMAINQSADSSVTGALTGQIAGAIYGTAGIPRRWADELELRDTLQVLCDDAAEAFAPPRMPKWAQRYVDNKRHLSGALALNPAESPASTVDSEAVVEDSAAQTTLILPVAQEGPAPHVDSVLQSPPEFAIPHVDTPSGNDPVSPPDPGLQSDPATPESAETWRHTTEFDRPVTGSFAEGFVGAERLDSVGDASPLADVVDEPATASGVSHAGEQGSAFPEEAASLDIPVPDPGGPMADSTGTASPVVGWEDEPSSVSTGHPVEDDAFGEPTGWDADGDVEPLPREQERGVAGTLAADADTESHGDPEFGQVADYPTPDDDSVGPDVPESAARGALDATNPAGGTGEFPSVNWVRLPTRGEGTYRDQFPRPGEMPETGSFPKRGHAPRARFRRDDAVEADPHAQQATHVEYPIGTEEPEKPESTDQPETPDPDPESDSATQLASPALLGKADSGHPGQDTGADAQHRDDDALPASQTRAGGGHAKVEGPESSAPSLIERVRGCLLGGALGDALGADIEFSSSANISTIFEEGPVGLRESYGVHGAITDDTQMTLFTAEGLIRGSMAARFADVADPLPGVQLAYQRWLHTQGVDWVDAAGEFLADFPAADGWLVEVPDLFRVRAPGSTVMKALHGFGGGKPGGSFTEILNDSKGCGGVMRAAPIALYSSDPSEVFTLAARSAALTHGHPSGYHSAGAFAVIVQQALLGHGLDDGVWLALQVLETWEDHEETSAMLKLAVDLASRGVPTPQQIEMNLGGGWVGEQALAIAVCSALACDDVETALKTAVHHSGDSDSTGAVCGNIVGALHGVDQLPVDWLGQLELRDVIEQLAWDCVVEFGVGEFVRAGDSTVQPGQDWSTRYPVAGVPFPGADELAAPGADTRSVGSTRLIPAVSASYGDGDVAEPVEPQGSGQVQPGSSSTAEPVAPDSQSGGSGLGGAEIDPAGAFPAPKPSPRRISGRKSVEQDG